MQVSAYYHQLALSQSTNDKGPTGLGYGVSPDAFQYLHAQVGPVGPRGPPGKFCYSFFFSFSQTIAVECILQIYLH